ncbi:MAG: hypothetical protein A2052_07330 [Deltaproteobacteria bacterium GWA2_54_12]|nr:MAG: hypothetical protein A2052_07330 [Deltaproteobacteria bacterium GWA2_54_12]
MSRISDLLSRIKQAEQKNGVPPGLTAAFDSSKRRSSGTRRAVLLVSVVALAIALGIATLYIAGALKNRTQGLQAAPAEQAGSLSAAAVIKDRPDSPAARQSEPPAERQEKIKPPAFQSVPKGEVASIEKASPVPPVAASSAYEPDRGVDTPAKAADNAPSGEQDHSGSRADKLAQELYLARNYERAGDNGSAVASYRKAIELDAGNYKAMNNIASILLKAGSTAEAVPYLKDSLSVQDSYVPALVNMGIALAREGDAAEAEAHFSKALSIEPANEAALLNMAVLYENSGRVELAREYYGRLRSLGHKQGAAGINRLR